MAKHLFSSENQPEKRRSKGPQFKTAMLQAIEKRFERGSAEFCEQVLEIGLTTTPTLLNECLKRIEPPLKPNGVTIQIEMPDNATHGEKAEVIFNAVADGTITLESGQMMIGMLKDTLQIIESTELVKRLEELESKLTKA